ncbi:MAG: hypothetical protein IIA75_05000 [Proteobacteria bacterium]|nr:hypothetical protein [Pseudomonadota bacterium]
MVKMRMIGVIEAAPERKRTLELDSVSRDQEVRVKVAHGLLNLGYRHHRIMARHWNIL